MARKIPEVFDKPMLLKMYKEMKNVRYFMGCLLGFFCGMRIGEVCSLKKDNVNLDRMTLKVVQGKGKKDRIIPLPEDIISPLRAYIELIEGDYLFPSRENQEGHMCNRLLSKYFNDVLKKTGYDYIAYKDSRGAPRFKFRFHSLRHSYATYLLNNGATKLIDEHDEVHIECIGGRMGRSKGDIPGVRWCVTKVNGQSLPALLGGKLEKARK